MNTLTVGDIITNAIQIGLKNMTNLVGAVILWLVTIWIPVLDFQFLFFEFVNRIQKLAFSPVDSHV